ncbi:MAG: hypothetical protein ACREFT_01025 [Acetobacteraceae bacterium]
MVWIFALGIIALAVFHPGFRKVVLVLAGVAAVVVAVGVAVALYQSHEQQVKEAEQAAALQAKTDAFRLAVRGYCSESELARIQQQGFLELWVSGGGTVAGFAKEFACVGVAQQRKPTVKPSASASLPAWVVQWDAMQDAAKQR